MLRLLGPTSVSYEVTLALRFVLLAGLLVAVSVGSVGTQRVFGQEDPEKHWAFRKLARTTPPQTAHIQRPRTPIDQFVLARLEEQGLSFSPDANRVTLVRRAYLDLIGLPPSPAYVDAFLADTAPGAYERLIDQLLASPHFGERWGRHWMDLVGYTDTIGFDSNPGHLILSEGKWRYRHYLIRAFNDDKPYDRFIQEQLAGDEMVDWRNAEKFTPQIRNHLIATGFLRTAQDFTHEPVSDIPRNHYAVLHDTLEIVGTSLLGLTLKCSRCHDHKFDPIEQQEYYRLMACFTPAYNSANWKAVFPWKPEIPDRALPDVSDSKREEIQRHNADIDRRIALLKQKISEKSANQKVNQQIETLNATRRRWGKIQALWDVGSPPRTHLLHRGDFQALGDEVQPGFLNALGGSHSDRFFENQSTISATSGRRTALAKWLTEADSPASALLARVMANRLWQHLFGQGIVATTENFGIGGQEPTHPELLEWLSSELVRSGWRIKPVIKQMMTSTVYRQSSSVADFKPKLNPKSSIRNPQSVDPGNQLLWRMRLRRLDAEVIRDSILSVAGTLDRTMGGPPIRQRLRTDGLVIVDEKQTSSPSARFRRSVYLLFRRAYNLTLLTTFDQPIIATTCSRRQPSAVVLQSLTMLNDASVFEQAEYFAERVAVAGDSHTALIESAFQLALARRPNKNEFQWCDELLRRQSQLFIEAGQPPEKATRRAIEQLCHMLFNTSEFLYAE